jgi:hypothetical protein
MRPGLGSVVMTAKELWNKLQGEILTPHETLLKQAGKDCKKNRGRPRKNHDGIDNRRDI